MSAPKKSVPVTGRPAPRRSRLAELASGAALDVRYALRGLARSPALAATILITLGLGVGALGAVFSVLDRIFLQAPSGVRDVGAVRRLVLTDPTIVGTGHVQDRVGVPDLADFRAAARRLATMEGYTSTVDHLSPLDSGRPSVAFTTTGYFGLLGVRPALGRFYVEEENQPDSPRPVVVLSYALWRSRFGGDTGVLGRMVPVGAGSFRVIGVAQAGFEGLDIGATDMWAPLTAFSAQFAPMSGVYTPMGQAPWQARRHFPALAAIVRLGPGVDQRRVDAVLTTRYRQTAIGEDAGDSAVAVTTGPLVEARGPRGIAGLDPRRFTIVMTVAAVSIITLLICVANVATLLLLRALRRRHEIAVRLALGISRPRLMGQRLTESVVLALVAGVSSLAVASAGGRMLRTTLLSNIHWGAAVVGSRGVVFAVATAALSGILAGLVPGLLASDARILDALKSGAPGAGRTRARVRGSLIALQASLCVVLLVCSGVFVQSLHRALTLDLGFDADQIAEVTTENPGETEAAMHEAVARIASVPGVDRVAVTQSNLLAPRGYSTSYGFLGRTGDTIPDALKRQIRFNLVDSAFFRTAGIRIVRGRAIDGTDAGSSEPVAVISEGMARRVWEGREALGDCFYVMPKESPCLTIVGIAGDTRRTVSGPAEMQVYMPLTQPPVRYMPTAILRGHSTYSGQVLIVRFSRPPNPAQIETVHGIAAASVVREAGAVLITRPWQELDPDIRPWRVGAILFTGFGLLTLFLAGVGLYGLVGYDVTARTREMGIRIALGAPTSEVLRLVLASGLRVALIGIVIGTAVALASVRVIASLLFDTSAADPVVLGASATLLIAVALAASVVPALRAARVDPVVVLRAD